MESRKQLEIMLLTKADTKMHLHAYDHELLYNTDKEWLVLKPVNFETGQLGLKQAGQMEVVNEVVIYEDNNAVIY